MKTSVKIDIPDDNSYIRLESTDDPDVLNVTAIMIDGKINVHDLLTAIAKCRLSDPMPLCEEIMYELD